MGRFLSDDGQHQAHRHGHTVVIANMIQYSWGSVLTAIVPRDNEDSVQAR